MTIIQVRKKIVQLKDELDNINHDIIKYKRKKDLIKVEDLINNKRKILSLIDDLSEHDGYTRIKGKQVRNAIWYLYKDDLKNKYTIKMNGNIQRIEPDFDSAITWFEILTSK